MSVFPDYEDNTIKEGFLCAVCKKDFPGPDELISHFVTHDKVQEEEEELKPVQTIGTSRDHYLEMKEIRDKRVERYEIETSKLLIRLNKLTTDVPSDEGKRKEHDQSIVLWISDQDVRLCPSCARSFNLTRRKHHCRLCGCVLCHNCSYFIHFDQARKLVDPDSDSAPSHSGDLKQSGDSFLTGNNFLTGSSSFNGNSLLNGLRFRHGSTSSLLSALNSSEKPNAVRTCFDCNLLMDRRSQQIEDDASDPLICRLYSRLISTQEDCLKLCESFSKMHMSLCLGEKQYELSDAQNVRVKLMKLSEEIDLISKRISSLGLDEPSPPSVPQLQLQSKIRMAATNFLKQNTLGIPSLPSEDDVIKLRRKRELEEEMERMRQLQKKERNRLTRKS